MKFITQQDIQAPQDFVFREASDFAAFERQALRRGQEITRTTGDADAALGTAWTLHATFQNRTWDIEAEIIKFEPVTGYVIEGKTDGLDTYFTVDLLALSRTITRLTVTMEIKPRTMTARLMLQSLKLIRGRVQGKLETWVAGYSAEIDRKYRTAGS